MSYAVKAVTTERGLDAGDFALVAYGGAGPLHAVQVAREIGIRTVIVPPAPGVFSAFGMLFSDLRYDFVRTWFKRLEDASFDQIERVYRELEEPGPRARSPPPRSSRRRSSLKRAADMRYVGQEHAVTVDLPLKVFEKQDRRGDQARISTPCTSCATARRRRTSAPRSSACAAPSPASCASRRRRRSSAASARPTRRRSPASGRSISTASSGRRRPTPAPRSRRATGSAARR